MPARKFKTPRVFEQSISLAGATLRQLFVVDLGHEEPTILLTNDRHGTHAKLLTRYAQRMCRHIVTPAGAPKHWPQDESA